MPTTKNKIEVFIEADGREILSNALTVTHELNGIPQCSISAVARNDEEFAVISNIENNLFANYTVKVRINGDETTIFDGIFTGAQDAASPNNININLFLYGGLYKLSQMGTSSLGLHSLGQTSMYRVSLNSSTWKNTILKESIDNTKGATFIDSLKSTLVAVFEYVTESINEITSDGGTSFGKVQQAVETLFQFHNTQNKSVLETELDRIIVAPGLGAELYTLIKADQVKNIILTLASNPSTTFWDLLIKLCDLYQINIGTFSDKVYAIPNSPVGEPGLVLDTGDITLIQISPIPLSFPTRCYFSTNGNLNEHLAETPVIGSFPSIKDADKPTSIETKIGTVRTIMYNMPDFVLQKLPIDATGNETQQLTALQEVYDRFAQTFVVKETFKHRTATVGMKFSPSIPVGIVVEFTDPTRNKKYQGYVTNVTHRLTGGEVSTTVNLQYVIGENEKTFFDLDSGGYLDNLVYPDYSASDLVSLLSL